MVFRCDGSNCGEYTPAGKSSADEEAELASPVSKNAPSAPISKSGSVKSSEHIIEIVIPSADSVSGGSSSGALEPSTAGELYEPTKKRLSESLEDTPEELLGSDTRPKIILHMPKKKKNANVQCGPPLDAHAPPPIPSSTSLSTKTDCDTSVIPLLRLSKDELMLLSQLSEKDLKENLLKALEEKDPT